MLPTKNYPLILFLFPRTAFFCTAFKLKVPEVSRSWVISISISISIIFALGKNIVMCKDKAQIRFGPEIPTMDSKPAADFSAGKQTWWSSASSWLQEPITLPENTFNSFLNLYSSLYCSKCHLKKDAEEKSPSFFWPAERQSSSCQCWVCVTAGRFCPWPNTRIQVFIWSCRAPKLAQKLLHYHRDLHGFVDTKPRTHSQRRCHIQHIPTTEKGGIQPFLSSWWIQNERVKSKS